MAAKTSAVAAAAVAGVDAVAGADANSPRDLFLIVATDGVWDVFSDEDAAAVVAETLSAHGAALRDACTVERADFDAVSDVPVSRRCFGVVATACADALVDEAYNRGSDDNLTAVVIIFGAASPTIAQTTSARGWHASA